MNALDRYLQQQVKKNFDYFGEFMPKLADMMGRVYLFQSRDEEIFDFELSGFKFTVSWETVEKQALGRTIAQVQFTLSVWHSVGGGRWHPPETVDVEIVKNVNINKVISEAFLTIYRQELEGATESVGAALLIEEEKNWEMA